MNKINNRACVFVGSFDPMTKGHVEIVKKCTQLFDTVYVGVLNNEDKSYFLNDEERLFCAKESLKGIEGVVVEKFDGLCVDYMRARNVSIYVRGLRNEADYKYECTIDSLNKILYPEIFTVFLQCDKDYVDVSSSDIRNKLLKGEDISQFVAPAVEDLMRKKVENYKIQNK